MKLTASQDELLEMLDRHSAEAEGMIYGTCHPDDREEAVLRVKLEHRLLRQAIRQVPSVTIGFDEPPERPEPEARMPRGARRQRVMAWFKEHPGEETRPRDLMKALDDGNASSISIVLRRLVNEGEIERVGQGRYKLKVEPPPPAHAPPPVEA